MPADKRKVAVIGSNSFSGSDFIDLLLERGEYSVLGISRSPEKSPLFLPYKRHENLSFRFQQLDLNKDMDRIIGLLDSFEPDYVIDSTKARKEFGWSTQILLDTGISGVVAWVERYWDEIQKEHLTYVHKP